MKIILRMGLLVYLMAANSLIAVRADVSNDLGAALGQVKNLRVARNEKFEANYQHTQCFDVFLIGSSTKTGLFCKSLDPQFVQEMGINEFDGLADATRPKIRPISGLVVSTPMGQYGMRPMPGTRGKVLEAAVDCDTEAGPIYRATASCSIAVTSLSASEVLYSNVVLKEHTTGHIGLTQARIQEIWRNIQSN